MVDQECFVVVSRTGSVNVKGCESKSCSNVRLGDTWSEIDFASL